MEAARRANATAAALSTQLKGVQAVGDDGAVVKVLMDCLADVVEGPVLRKAAVQWFDETGVGGDDGGKKFSDGIASASEATPEMLTNLEFYPASYRPLLPTSELVAGCVAQWFAPTRLLWNADAMADLKGNCDLMQRRHHGGHPEHVVPLFLYSASQKGRRCVWAVLVAPAAGGDAAPAWRALHHDGLETVFQTDADSRFPVDPTWFPKKLGLRDGVIPPGEVHFERADQGHAGVDLTVCTAPHFMLVRYALQPAARGDPKWSPWHDTVAWLPPAVVGDDGTPGFARPFDQYPPPGVLEYLYSKDPAKPMAWAEEEGHEWRVQHALGDAAVLLAAKCFAEPNQQDYNAALHQEVTELVAAVAAQDAAALDRLHSTLAAYALTHAISVPQGAPGPGADAALIAPVVQEIVAMKLAGIDNPAPANLAHCLEIQHLRWCGGDYFAALSGENPTCTVRGGVAPSLMTRCTSLYDDQIFWQMNRAMRMKQWGVEAHLQVNAGAPCDTAGAYHVDGAVPKSFADPPAPFRSKATGAPAACERGGGWTVTVARKGVDRAVRVPDHYLWFEMGTWLLPQQRPLQYYIDTSLAGAVGIDGCKAPRGLVTYRGLKNVTLDRDVYDTGRIVLWGAYSSTSCDRGIAMAFARAEGRAAVFTMEGERCVCISRWSRFEREREWLYPPNSAFQVASALSSEHAELAGKKDLQIFGLSEVGEVESLIVYLRGVVNRVVAKGLRESAAPRQGAAAAAADGGMPSHVEQLFQIMLLLVDYKNDGRARDLDLALQHTCDPTGTVLYTPEGPGLARKLLGMGASEFVMAKLGRAAGPEDTSKLLRLQASGATTKAVLGWMGEFERGARADAEVLETCERRHLHGAMKLTVAEEAERAAQLRFHEDFTRSGDVAAVTVARLTGAQLYFNGLYVRAPAEEVRREGHMEGAQVFKQVNPTRLGAYCEIALQSHPSGIGEWLLTDTTLRAALRGAGGPPAWLAGSYALEGQWGAAGGGAAALGYPFVTTLQANPQTVIYSPHPQAVEVVEWATATAPEVEEECAAALDGDDDDDEGRRGAATLAVLCARFAAPLPVPCGYRADWNILPVVPAGKAAAKEAAWWRAPRGTVPGALVPGNALVAAIERDDKQRAKGLVRFSCGVGRMDFEEWRTGITLRKVAAHTSAVFHRSTHGSHFAVAALGDVFPAPPPRRSARRKPRHAPPDPARKALLEAFNQRLVGAMDALQRASGAVTADAVRARVASYEKRQLHRRVVVMTQHDGRPEAAAALWERDEGSPTGEAMREYLRYKSMQLKDRLGEMAFAEKVRLCPEHVPELRFKPALSAAEDRPFFSPADAAASAAGDAHESKSGQRLTPLSSARGIVTIAVGQAGVQMGAACWELYCLEHGIDAAGQPTDSFCDADHDPRFLFDETSTGHVPRAVFIDSEPGTIGAAMKRHGLGSLVPNHCVVEGREDCADNYGRGYYGLHKTEVGEQSLEASRLQAEACDFFTGYQFLLAGSGGTGGGYAPRLMQLLRMNTRAPFYAHVVLPSLRPGMGSPVESVNYSMAHQPLTENADVVVGYDNFSLYHAAIKQLGLSEPGFADMNRVVANVVNATTAATRMRASLTAAMKEVSIGLVPYPRVNLVVPAFAPLVGKGEAYKFPEDRLHALAAVARAAASPSNVLVSVDPCQKPCFALYVAYRGRVEPCEAHCVKPVFDQRLQRCGWSGIGFKMSIASRPVIQPAAGHIDHPGALCATLNNTAAIEGFYEPLQRYGAALHRKRAFLHHLVSEGMDTEDVEYAFEHVRDCRTSVKELTCMDEEKDEEDDDHY